MFLRSHPWNAMLLLDLLVKIMHRCLTHDSTWLTERSLEACNYHPLIFHDTRALFYLSIRLKAFDCNRACTMHHFWSLQIFICAEKSQVASQNIKSNSKNTSDQRAQFQQEAQPLVKRSIRQWTQTSQQRKPPRQLPCLSGFQQLWWAFVYNASLRNTRHACWLSFGKHCFVKPSTVYKHMGGMRALTQSV